MKFIKTVPLVIMLSACSSLNPFGGGDDDEIIFDTTLGPKTEQQVRQLGTGLEGDSANANYSSEDKKGDKLESEDGSGS
jgi:hypothetical protein